MKRIPRVLATLLIFALLNVSYINIALAATAPSPGDPAAIPAATPDPNSNPVPQGPPDHATKDQIKQDLDDAVTELQALLGTDPDSFGNQFLKKAGLDPFEDITDAKNELDALSDTDFEGQQGYYDKFHKKAQKRKKHMSAILNNKALLARLHAPSPIKFRVIVSNPGATMPGGKKVTFNRAASENPALPSPKSASEPASFTKGLGNISVTLMPEYDATCNTGPGLPGGMDDLMISKMVTHAVDVVKELIPDDTAAVVPQAIATAAWGVAKAAELVVESLHAVYLECKAEKEQEELKTKIDNLPTGIVNSVNNHTDAKHDTLTTKIDNTATSINNNNNSNKTDINTNVNNAKTDIITKIGEGAGQTTQAVNDSTTTINTNITTNITNLNTAITNTKNEINTSITNTKNELNQTINDNRTLIINNAASNTLALTSLSLRLMIEADLAAPDASVPLALFETPGAKGGHLELVRSIVVETITNLAGTKAANANASLKQGDAYKAAGNFKAAYAQYRKAYKTAAT